jgi:serine protease inhibitor
VSDPFQEGQTREQPFTRTDGSTVDVPLMSRDGQYAIAEQERFTMARLPYGDGRFGMEILLPDRDLSELVRTLDRDAWEQAVADLREQRVHLLMPQLDISYDTELNDVLGDLGMGIAFTGAADFRPMSPADPWIDVIAHETRLIVDEEGTEAAAVTGGAMPTSAPPQFRVDRSFLFTISDTETGAILFLGAITDPTG